MDIGKIYVVQYGNYAGLRGELVKETKVYFWIVATNSCACEYDEYGYAENHSGYCWHRREEIKISKRYTPERYEAYKKRLAEQKRAREEAKTRSKIDGTILTLRGLALKYKSFKKDIEKEVQEVLKEI